MVLFSVLGESILGDRGPLLTRHCCAAAPGAEQTSPAAVVVCASCPGNVQYRIGAIDLFCPPFAQPLGRPQ